FSHSSLDAHTVKETSTNNLPLDAVNLDSACIGDCHDLTFYPESQVIVPRNAKGRWEERSKRWQALRLPDYLERTTRAISNLETQGVRLSLKRISVLSGLDTSTIRRHPELRQLVANVIDYPIKKLQPRSNGYRNTEIEPGRQNRPRE